MFQRIVAIGDSFTEGMGDPGPDGQPRGWADLLAAGLDRHARTAGSGPLSYANLAIRGRRLPAIIDEQLGPALALAPDLITFNGGGNDLMRPRVSVAEVAALTRHVVQRVRATGVHLYLCSGADASGNLPMGGVLRRRAAALTEAVHRWADAMPGVTVVDNFADPAFADPRMWSPDGLHLNRRGHRRAATNALHAFGLDADALLPPEETGPAAHHHRSAAYYREHVVPWVGRRLTGRSSGDGRVPKRPVLTPLG